MSLARYLVLLAAVALLGGWLAFGGLSGNRAEVSASRLIVEREGDVVPEGELVDPRVGTPPERLVEAARGEPTREPTSELPEASPLRLPFAAPSEGEDSVEIPLEPPLEWELAGPVKGLLTSESGVFTGDADALVRGLTIDLVSKSNPRVETRATLTPILNEEGALTAIAFETEDLPAVTFEVTLSSLDHRRWAPTSQDVMPPASGVSFLCYDGDQAVPLAFVVTDADTGDPVEGWSASQFRASSSDENGVLLHAGPLAMDAFPLNGRLQWALEADGYAAAYGDERAFALDPETGKWTAHVALRKGFATRLVVLGKNPDRVLASGADVYTDGTHAGRTDTQGVLVLAGSKTPERIRIRWGDQALEGDFTDVCLRRRSHLYVALLEGAGD